MFLIVEFIIISIRLVPSWVGVFSIILRWSKKRKNIWHEGLIMLCTWYHLSTQQHQDRWRYFLLMRSRLECFPFSCCKSICGDFDCSYCKIFCFYIQHHCDTFPYRCSIICFLSRLFSFRQLLMFYHSYYSYDYHRRNRHTFVEVGLFGEVCHSC